MPEEQNLEQSRSATAAVRAEVEEKVVGSRRPRKLFGTFSGVFTPTLLTILGVIMFLRQGWVVGNAGLLGAWLIILLAFAITAFTAFSLSSIVTNIRIGAGGAFSIISQSLGLEVGGSIGIPLYISKALALLGAIGCVFVMFVINPAFGGVAVVVVLFLHAYLLRRHLKAPFGDVRSGLFAALAEWAAKKIESLAGPRAKTWKANLLVPVQNPAQAEELYPLLHDFAAPRGFVRMLGLTGKKDAEEISRGLEQLSSNFQEDDIFSNWTIIDSATFSENLAAGIEALGGAFFRSSVIVMRFLEDQNSQEDIRRIIGDTRQYGLGLVLVHGGSEDMDQRGLLHLVLRRPKDGWKIGLDLGASDLALLTAYKLKQNRQVDLVLTAVIDDENEKKEALDYLRTVAELGRIPNVRFHARTDETIFDLEYGSGITVTLFSMKPDTDFETMRSLAEQAGTLCVFAMDSGKENALI